MKGEPGMMGLPGLKGHPVSAVVTFILICNDAVSKLLLFRDV